MKLLYMAPGWALRCIRDYCQHRETSLQQQSGPITSSLNSDYWLVVFFRKELVQQYRSLKQVNQELKRRNHLSDEATPRSKLRGIRPYHYSTFVPFGWS